MVAALNLSQGNPGTSAAIITEVLPCVELRRVCCTVASFHCRTDKSDKCSTRLIQIGAYGRVVLHKARESHATLPSLHVAGDTCSLPAAPSS